MKKPTFPVQGTGSTYSSIPVRGYLREGQWIQPHMRSVKDNTRTDNWTTKGNFNPFTGKPGTKR